MKIQTIFTFVLLAAIAGCQKPQTTDPDTASNKGTSKSMRVDANGLSKQTATLRIKQGAIKIAFYPEKAPATVARITELIAEGFYNGIIFHRVVEGFVAQAGDPTGTGTGGSGKNIPAEFNDIEHVKGIIAMARTSDPNSADSQFYISLGRLQHLDRNYTVFAKVVEGIELIDKIQKGDKILKFEMN